ncbi:MAG: diguanylate cyclase [Anaerolineaceae bacterium]|nr:diguanylate cyclase [Anaerolineaceae bacterium]
MDYDQDFYKSVLDNLYDGVYFVDQNRRITYWSKGAERISGFQADRVIGSFCSDNILMHVDDNGILLCNNACPLAKTMQDGLNREVQVYLHHASGYRLPVFVRSSPMRNSAGEITGAVEVFSDSLSLMSTIKTAHELQNIASLDPLTGIANRAAMEGKLQSCLAEFQSQKQSMALLIANIDQFKRVNDTYGQEFGDKILKMVSTTINLNTRSYDFVGRWGGDEFAIILVNVDDAFLHTIASKLLSLVENSSLSFEHKQVHVTVSIGAALARPSDDVSTLIKRADLMLYQSKYSGHNLLSISA